MKKHSYIGLDVHKESISIALRRLGAEAKCASRGAWAAVEGQLASSR